MSVATVVSAANGTVPVTASIKDSARQYTSALPSTVSPRACSGDGVARGAEQHPVGLGPRRLGQRPGQAEVGDAQAAVLAEQQVRRLDVAVDEALAVGVVEAPGRLETDEQRLGRASAAAGVEHAPQAAAAEVLADQVRARHRRGPSRRRA